MVWVVVNCQIALASGVLLSTNSEQQRDKQSSLNFTGSFFSSSLIFWTLPNFKRKLPGKLIQPISWSKFLNWSIIFVSLGQIALHWCSLTTSRSIETFLRLLEFAEPWKLQKKSRRITMNSRISWRRMLLVGLIFQYSGTTRTNHLVKLRKEEIGLFLRVFLDSPNIIHVCHRRFVA